MTAARPRHRASTVALNAEDGHLFVTWENSAEIHRFFDDLAVVEPGVTHLSDWRPRDDEPRCAPEQAWVVGEVGRWEEPAD